MKEDLIEKIQKELKIMGIDGWFFCSFRGSDPIADSFLRGESEGLTTRRYFYFIPVFGEPVKVLHRIEPESLKKVPGRELFYSRYDEWQNILADEFKNVRKIACQYSENGLIPAISRLDAGIYGFLKSLNLEIVSSQDLVSKFSVTLNEDMIESHRKAIKILEEGVFESFKLIKNELKNERKLDEYKVQSFLLEYLKKNSLITSSPPIVAVNENAANPHYEPSQERRKEISKNDLILIDVWAKENREEGIYADITWCGSVSEFSITEYENIFNIVIRARDKAIEKAKEVEQRDVEGWEVDRAARDLIEKEGYGEYFTHRTGHSIFKEDHADGANMDDFETKDTRKLLPNTLFSVEPGIYIKGKYGFRSEVNVLVREKGIEVTGSLQKELIKIL